MTRQLWWPPLGRSHGHQRAVLLTVSGQFLLALDRKSGAAVDDDMGLAAETALRRVGPGSVLVLGDDLAKQQVAISKVSGGRLVSRWHQPGLATTTWAANGRACVQAETTVQCVEAPGSTPVTYYIESAPEAWGDPGTLDGATVVKGGPGIYSTHLTRIVTTTSGKTLLAVGNRAGTIVQNPVTGTSLNLPRLGAVFALEDAFSAPEVVLIASDALRTDGTLQAINIDPVTLKVTSRASVPFTPAANDFNSVTVAQSADGSVWIYCVGGGGDAISHSLYRMASDSSVTQMRTPPELGLSMTGLSDGLLYFYGGRSKNVVASFDPQTGVWTSDVPHLRTPAGTYVTDLVEA